MEKSKTEKLFRVLVVGGAMIASGRAVPACGNGSTNNGGGQSAVGAFNDAAAEKLVVPECTTWGAM